MTEEKKFNPLQSHPLLIVISGPSGVGKDTVIECMKDQGLPFYFVVTATNRPPRPEEVNGVDYWFVSTAEFAEMINRNELIEYAIVYNAYKGIPKQQVREALASGQDVVMRIDVQGAATIKSLYPDALLIFLTTQTDQELIDRLEKRGSESTEDLQLRIATAVQELRQIDRFDYVVVNPDCKLGDTVDTIRSIISAEHHRVKPRKVSL